MNFRTQLQSTVSPYYADQHTTHVADLIMHYRMGKPVLWSRLEHITEVLRVWCVNFILTGTVLAAVKVSSGGQ